MPVHVALALMLLNLPLKLWAGVFCSSVRVNFTERNFNSVLLIVYCLVRALLTLFPQHNSHLWTVPLVEFEVTVLHITVWPLWVLLSMACVGSVIGLLYHAVESWRTNINNRVHTSPNCNSTALTVAACLLTVLSVAHILFASTFIYQQWGEDYWFPLGIALVGLPGVFLVVQSLVQTVFICHCLCFTDQLADTVLPQLKWHKHMNFIFSWNTLLLLAVAYFTQSAYDTLFVTRIVLSLCEAVHRIFCGILFHHLEEKFRNGQYSEPEAMEESEKCDMDKCELVNAAAATSNTRAYVSHAKKCSECKPRCEQRLVHGTFLPCASCTQNYIID